MNIDEMQPQHRAFFEELDREGCSITSRPCVLKEEGHNTRDVDDMLDELGRRMHKNGRLDEFEQRQHFTSDSKQKREEKEAQAYRAEERGSRRRWRGGVEV